MIKLVDDGLGRFYRLISNVTGIVIGLFAILIVADLVLRKLGLPLIKGMQEIIEYALYVVVFLGAPWVLRLGAHIRIDIMLSMIGEKRARFFEIILDLVGFVICLLLVYYGVRNLIDAYEFGSAQRQVFVVMEWHLLVIFVLSFVLCALEFLLRIWRGPQSREGAQ